MALKNIKTINDNLQPTSHNRKCQESLLFKGNVRIHCIVVQKFGCIVGRNKKCLSLSRLGLLVPCSLASGSGGSNIEDLYFNFHLLTFPSFPLCKASDISRGRGPAKFKYFREIPRNSQKNVIYREIRQKYFQMCVSKTYLILILAIRPVLFTPNVQIYLETSSLQQVNNVPKLPGVLRLMLRKTGH